MTDQTTTTDGTTTQSTTAATTATTATGGTTDTTLLQAQPGDWIPEKHRVFKEGTQDLDIDASNRKLGEAYKALEQRMGQGGLVPATVDDYKIEDLGEGINIDEVRKDPMFAEVLKKAHEAKIPQDALNWAMQTYFRDIAPNLLAADAALTAEEAKAELSKAWGDEAAVSKNLAAANRAFNGFATKGDGVGSTARLIEKFGTDPDFLAFAAAVGGEMSEDTPITEGSQAAGDWQTQVDALRADPAYNDASHPQHAQKKAQMEQLYQKRYGTAPHRLGGGAVR